MGTVNIEPPSPRSPRTIPITAIKKPQAKDAIRSFPQKTEVAASVRFFASTAFKTGGVLRLIQIACEEILPIHSRTTIPDRRATYDRRDEVLECLRRSQLRCTVFGPNHLGHVEVYQCPPGRARIRPDEGEVWEQEELHDSRHGCQSQFMNALDVSRQNIGMDLRVWKTMPA